MQGFKRINICQKKIIIKIIFIFVKYLYLIRRRWVMGRIFLY